ncbi:hypothetical protein ACFW4O_26955 [Streptomyces mutabilis]|uniref:hypothetical protein n=1 Tax=Streptomyces TaxID=1883 RepID=UPI0022BA4499|nr:hypothetical protein [Streptomyces mutabilis]MCZ9354126.1 hypothetical protein [Streptomyces mutabilis]
MGAAIGLAQYQELFSGRRFRDDLRPFDGASADEGSGRSAEVGGANKVQPLASEVQQPPLAAALYMIQTLASHILREAEVKRKCQPPTAASPRHQAPRPRGVPAQSEAPR